LEEIKRLAVLSIIPSVYMMIHVGNDVTAPTAQAATLAVTFPSFCSKAALLFSSPLVVVGVVVVVVMFKSLHLAEICNLRSAF